MHMKMATRDTSIRKAAIILGAITAMEGFFVFPPLVMRPVHFLSYLGLAPGHHLSPPLGWILAVLVTALFVWHGVSLPSVREHLLRPSWLKVLAIGLAVAAGILEEIFFRQILMDWAQKLGWGAALQIILSAVVFGLAHAIWAFFRGSWRAGVGAMIATGVLGLMLAIVYLAGNRSLGPCVASHFVIDVFLEPGLVLAAVRGEMGKRVH
jgi:membrane protease YdiL (CAAX protease family)